MDPLCILSEQAGFFTRAQARDCGCSERQIAALLRQRVWTRFRRGYYCHTEVWDALDEVARHRIRCAAVIDSLGIDAVVISHGSGVILHRIETWGVDLSRVHVTRRDGGAGRTEGDVIHHEGFVTDDEICWVDGVPVLAAARCTLEAASIATDEAALCLLDSGLHLRRFERDQLEEQFVVMEHWPHTRHLHIPVRMADGASESVGESRGRWFFWVHRLPAPQLQYRVLDEHGALIGTTDWAWPEREALGEFDGEKKYGRLLKPGMEAGDVAFAEKQREDALRSATGFTMARIIWLDYRRPRVLEQRLRRLLGMSDR